MHEKIMYGREQLERLNALLEQINVFLIGDKTTKPCEESKQETCLLDTIEANNNIINQCLEKANCISDVIIGKRG